MMLSQVKRYRHKRDAAQQDDFSLQAYVDLRPLDLLRRCGIPRLFTGDAESLGQYYFVGEDGKVVATVYYRLNDNPYILILLIRCFFWFLPHKCSFHIGARDEQSALTFVDWLRRTVRER